MTLIDQKWDEEFEGDNLLGLSPAGYRDYRGGDREDIVAAIRTLDDDVINAFRNHDQDLRAEVVKINYGISWLAWLLLVDVGLRLFTIFH